LIIFIKSSHFISVLKPAQLLEDISILDRVLYAEAMTSAGSYACEIVNSTTAPISRQTVSSVDLVVLETWFTTLQQLQLFLLYAVEMAANS